MPEVSNIEDIRNADNKQTSFTSVIYLPESVDARYELVFDICKFLLELSSERVDINIGFVKNKNVIPRYSEEFINKYTPYSEANIFKTDCESHIESTIFYLKTDGEMIGDDKLLERIKTRMKIYDEDNKADM